MNEQHIDKFCGNDETGTVGTLCSHIILQSISDMYIGERYVILLGEVREPTLMKLSASLMWITQSLMPWTVGR